MDATNNKNLARALVALMVGSTFLAAIAPVAEATHFLTGGTDVTIDVRQTPTTVTIQNGTAMVFANVFVPTSPTAFKLRHSTAYELTFVGIDTRTGAGTGYGYTNGFTSGNIEIINVSSGAVAVAGTQLVQGPEGPTGNLRNATFLVTSGNLQGPGLYALRTVSGTPRTFAYFAVYPTDDINVAITTNVNPLIWSGNQVVVNIATGVASAVISSQAPSLITGAPATDINGNFAFLSTLPMGAGNWIIYAAKDNNPGGIQLIPGQSVSMPERMGNATLNVASNTLGVTTVSSTAFVGFDNTVAYTVHFPATNNNVFASTVPTDATVARYNLSILTPTNFLYVRNITGALPTSGSLTTAGAGWACQNRNDPTQLTVTAGQCGTADDLGPLVAIASVNSVNQLTIRNNTWQAGSYAIRLELEADATADDCTTGTPTFPSCSPPEFVAAWSLSPATASAVTLSSTPATLDVPYANSAAGTAGAGLALTSPTNAAVGTTTLTVTVSGSSLNEHPLCRLRAGDTSGNPPGTGTCDPTGATFGANLAATPATFGTLTDVQKALLETDALPTGCTAGACFVDNISVGGDVLPGWKVTGYTPSSGAATIVMTPARNGTAFINVTWKGATTTLTVPVNNGARATASITNLTVDTPTQFTVNVKNAFGGNAENANVFVFARIIDATTGLASTGAFQGTGATVIVGTGAAGAGAGGDYSFNLRPSQVQDLVVYAEVGSTGGRTNATYVPLTVLPSQTLVSTLSVNNTMAALRTAVHINVTNQTLGWTATASNFKVYFLTPTQHRDLTVNGTTALFTGANIPTAVTIDNNNAAGAFFNVTLTSENDYHVWFCASTVGAITDCRTATHDNRANMPVFNVTRYTATFSPTQIASSSDIAANTQVMVTVTDRNGAHPNGTLRITQVTGNNNIVTGVSPGGANTAGGTSVTNGVANITLTGAGTVGQLHFEFDPAETGTQTNVFAGLTGNLSIVAGNLTFTPTRVPILQSTLVTIRLANFTGAGLAGRNIRLCSVSLNSNFPGSFPADLLTTDIDPNTAGVQSAQQYCTAAGVTGDDGSTGIVVTPTALSPIGVYINNSYTQRTLPVTAGTLIVTVNPTTPTQGGNATFTVTQPGGVASAGARILVLRNGTSVLDATADGNGQATLTNLAQGAYSVTAIRTGYDNGTASFQVGPAASTNASRFELRNLVVPDRVNVGTPVTVRVTVANTGTASGSANAVLLVNNIQRGSQNVTLAVGANQTLEYEFNATIAGTYSVVVRIGDVTLGPQDITVGTPTLTTPTSTPTQGVTPPTGTPPTATPPTATPPTRTTATPPTSSPAATTPEPTVPGFEVVALLAALGVALLVLRRKNN